VGAAVVAAGASINLPSAGDEWFGGDWSNGFNGGRMPQWLDEAVTWFEATVTPMFATEERAIRSVIAIVAVIVGISLLISLLLALVRYPSETAVMRLVDEYEQTGRKMKFKEGWQLGWHNRAWKLFLIDLLIGTPAFTIFILLVGWLVWLVYGLVRAGSIHLEPGAIIGIIFVSLFFLAFGLLMALVSLLRQYVARFVTLEGSGVGAAFKLGWEMFKRRFWGTVVLGLAQIGLGIAFGFAALLAAFLLIPAYAILALPGGWWRRYPAGWLTCWRTSVCQTRLPSLSASWSRCRSF